MTTTNDGGPAFPSRTETSMRREDGTKTTTMVEDGFRGLSLRDYMAAAALTGIMAYWGQADEQSEWPFKKAASDAYAQADAMLTARTQGAAS